MILCTLRRLKFHYQLRPCVGWKIISRECRSYLDTNRDRSLILSSTSKTVQSVRCEKAVSEHSPFNIFNLQYPPSEVGRMRECIYQKCYYIHSRTCKSRESTCTSAECTTLALALARCDPVRVYSHHNR